jgi:glycosyltransferase involved in cell wall biosynthesis
MKIAIIGPAHPLRGGGISTFNERLAEVLQQNGHEVTIYSFTLQYPSFLFPGKSQFTTEPAPGGLKIVSLINSINPVNWISSGLTIKKSKPDIVIVRYWLPFMGPCLGTILRIIKGNKGTKIVCIADNVSPHEKRPGDEIFTRYFIKPVDSFITMSRDVLKDLERFTKKPSLYTPHPLYDNYGPAVTKDEACKKLGIDPSENYMLFFGFIRKYKGLDILLQAMQDANVKEKGIKLIVAGEFYDDKSFYGPLIEEVNEQVILFTDFIPNEEVKYYFSAADVVVQPYRSATQSGITQIAYHFEKPMIVTNVGGLAEVVKEGETGFVVQPDAALLAEAISRFFTEGSIPGLEQNIKSEKEKYSWDNFTSKLFSLAEKIS